MAEFTKVFTNNSQFKLILVYSHSQNITNNTTTVSATLKVQSMAYGVASGWVNKSAGISINGNNVTYTFNPNMGANSTKTIATRSYTFAHNANGTKSVNISANANYTGITWGGVGIGNVTLGGTVSLPTIPRASSISSISGGTLGSALTVNISRASSSFTHRVGYYRTNGSREMPIIENVGTSTSFTLPLSDASLLPSSTTGTAKIVIDTYSGSTKIGSASRNFTVTVPTSMVPTSPNISSLELNGIVKSLNLPSGDFVQGKSSVKLSSEGAQGSYSSHITAYEFYLEGVGRWTVNNNYIDIAANQINRTGRLECSVRVKDSRGRYSSYRVSDIRINAYSRPKITLSTAIRQNNTSTVVVRKSISATRIMGDKSNYTVKILSLPPGATVWNTLKTETNKSDEYSTFTNFDKDKSYGVRVVVEDVFGEKATSDLRVSTSKTLIDLNKDIGVGFGKIHENGAVDIGGDLYVGGVSVDYATGTVYANHLKGKMINETKKFLQLRNGWIQYGAEYQAPFYWKDSEGIVHVGGLAKNGSTSANVVIGVLPSGYRSFAREVFVGWNGDKAVRIDILPNGDIVSPWSLSTSSWLSLSGISFKAEN